jgi:transcriptional regulator with XRE-family HTH domain
MEGLGMAKASQREMQTDLDEALMGFRVARKSAGRVKGLVGGGWLRAVRLAVDVRVDELAGRLGTIRSEIYRLEKAEKEARITVKSLRRAADALGCELIYALVPQDGTVKGLAEAELRRRNEAAERAREKKASEPGMVLLRRAILKKIRHELRLAGMRTR